MKNRIFTFIMLTALLILPAFAAETDRQIIVS